MQGLVINLNGKRYVSKNGLLDLLQRKTNADELRYPIIHLKGEDIEVALYAQQSIMAKIFFQFVNGNTQHRAAHISRHFAKRM